MDANKTVELLNKVVNESTVDNQYKNYINFIKWKIEREYNLDMEKKIESVREN